MTNYCGECKHWHYSAEKTGNYHCRIGDCDAVPKGAEFRFEVDGKEYVEGYDGYSFEDEAYDEYFSCFIRREEE